MVVGSDGTFQDEIGVLRCNIACCVSEVSHSSNVSEKCRICFREFSVPEST